MTDPPSNTCILPLQEQDITDVIQLARDTWYAHYTSIITVEQIEYMLAQRYHPDVIRSQLASDRAWWDKLMLDKAIAAFAAYELGKVAAEMKLDKLYVRYDLRGRGFGSALIAHVALAARRQGCQQLSLQVNKNNASAIAAYKRNGFAIRESAKFDIGGGFAMDDYVMSKDLR